MSDLRYREAFQIRPASNYKGGKKKKKKKGMSRRAEFSGVISNTNLDSYNTHIGEGALRSFARDARKGVPILGLHDRASQIGRSTSGTFSPSKKNVSSDFYIQRGLSLNSPGYGSSDDYIESVDEGTMRDLSVGFVPKMETCDHCGSEMIRTTFFGINITECKNGHYPGMKTFVDKNGKEVTEDTKGAKEITVTSTIDEAELKEFSVVPFGATPGAEIAENVMRAYQSGQLEEKHRIQINNEYQIRFDTRSNKPLVDEFLKSIQEDKKTKQSGGQRMATKNDRTEQMLDQAKADRDSSQVEVIEEISEKLEAAELELERLRDTYGDEEGNIDKAIVERDREIDRLREELSEKSIYEEEYERVLDKVRKDAMDEFDRKSGYKATTSERQEMESYLESEKSHMAIDQLRKAWKETADASDKMRSGRRTKDSYTDNSSNTDELFRRARVASY